MPKSNKIDKYLNNNYHQDVAFFPRKVRQQETDDFIAWKVGWLPVMASTKNISLSMCFTQFNQLVTAESLMT